MKATYTPLSLLTEIYTGQKRKIIGLISKTYTLSFNPLFRG